MDASEEHIIEGKDYYFKKTYKRYNRGHYEDCYFSCGIHVSEDKKAVSILLDSDVPCHLTVIHFEGGQLKDIGAGSVLSPPYLFEPGSYQLEAVIPGEAVSPGEKSVKTHPTTDQEKA